MAKTKNKAEFGDFQTPQVLARQVCELVRTRIPVPATIIEPTCGLGGLLLAGADAFPEAQQIIGSELSPVYAELLQLKIATRPDNARFLVQQQDYFTYDWRAAIMELPTPMLLLGNPPWVTNSELSVLGSDNKPERYNFQKFSGMDALTGKSNFDISEWMLLDMLRWLNGRDATLAMLVKTAVARKALVYAWKKGLHVREAAIYQIDAFKHFNAAVDACLLICRTDLAPAARQECQVYTTLESVVPSAILSYREGKLVADGVKYERWQHLQGQSSYKWRSGIKHDCAKVMELVVGEGEAAGAYCNGLGEVVQLEDTYVLPMLKTSEVANGKVQQPKRRMIVTQRTTGESTDLIQTNAPATWAYLEQHGSQLDGRQSIIYKKRPRFSIFGIGDYSFASWKVAISGLYKRLRFTVIGPYEGRPIVLDDTTYFLSCQSEEEAQFLTDLLNSEVASEFFEAFIFWDSKRPITVDLLQRLDLKKLAREMGLRAEFESFTRPVEQPAIGLFA